MASIEERQAKGAQVREALFGSGLSAVMPPDDLMADFSSMLNEWLFGGVWSRPGLEMQQRSMITMAVLTALGRQEELRIHIGAALRLGLTKEQITELLTHVAFYAGVPAAVTGFRVAREVFAGTEQSAPQR